MDEILDRFRFTLVSNSTPEYSALYKNWGRLEQQEERRREYLQRQKSDRSYNVNKIRGILDYLVVPNQNISINDGTRGYRPSIYVAGFTEAPTTYRNILMLSEWMVERPYNFENDWLVTPCPKGTRCLLIASMGYTKLYNKYGMLLSTCSTALPGGNKGGRKMGSHCTILDGIYNKVTETFYILDLLSWNLHNMSDGETCFRQYWLETQLIDIPAINTISDRNNIIIKLLTKQPCNLESLNELFMKYPPFENNLPELDGFLFYHKNSHYFSGETPLVGWLYPFMLKEILGNDVMVHESFLATKPEDYVDQHSFIEKFEKKIRHKKKLLNGLKPLPVAGSNELQIKNPATSPNNKTVKKERKLTRKSNNVFKMKDAVDDSNIEKMDTVTESPKNEQPQNNEIGVMPNGVNQESTEDNRVIIIKSKNKKKKNKKKAREQMDAESTLLTAEKAEESKME